MANRFEVVKKEAVSAAPPMFAFILRDRTTGVLYISFNGGLAPLVDRDGKPLTSLD